MEKKDLVLGSLGMRTMLEEVGMATGRVRAGFFHTRARPAGLDPRPEPGPISKRIFFLWGPDPPHRAPRAPRAPLGHGTSGPILWPKIFFFCLILIFSATKQVGEKEHKKIQI